MPLWITAGIVAVLILNLALFTAQSLMTAYLTKQEQARIDATGYKKPVEMLLDKGGYVNMPLANSFVAPLPDEMQILATQIGDIVKTQSWLAVYAADEAEFDQIVNDMYEAAMELGLEELMEYNKTAWEAAFETAAKYE